jgi:hypothetical protein
MNKIEAKVFSRKAAPGSDERRQPMMLTRDHSRLQKLS